jgi:hypothetical protein
LTTSASIISSDEEESSLLVSNFTSLEDSDEIFADKIAGDLDVTYPLRVPKYFQAIITLFVCATLLLCTLGIIKQVRLMCHQSSCHSAKIPLIRVSSGKKNDEDDLDSVLVEKNGGVNKEGQKNGETNKAGDRHFDYYNKSGTGKEEKPTNADTPMNSTTNGTSNGGDNDDLLKPKKVRFVRRTSGPFSDEAMDFAGATYKQDKMDAPYLSKEKSKSSKKIEPQIKFSSMSMKKPPAALPPAPLPIQPPPRSSLPPPPPRSSPPPL